MRIKPPKILLLMKDGTIKDPTLYCHQETVTLGGVTYYLLKETTADTTGLTLQADGSEKGDVVWGKFVFQLTGVVKILRSDIVSAYRVSASTTGGVYEGELDLLIRQADGTLRTTLATDVAKTFPTNYFTSWLTRTTVTSYQLSEYTVVDQTDYLEVDYVCEITTNVKASYVYLRIDDNTLDTSDQTRNAIWDFLKANELEKSPTANLGQWQSPENAYSSNDLRAWIDVGAVGHSFYNYDISLAGYQIDKLIVKIEHYESGIEEALSVQISTDGGLTWSDEVYLPQTTSEWIDYVDFAGPFTPDQLSNTNFQVGIRSTGIPGPGCLHKSNELCVYKDMKRKVIQDFKVGDKILGFQDGEFKLATVKNITYHSGKYTFYKITCHYRMHLWDEEFRGGLSPNDIGYKDIILTGNHPIPTVFGGVKRVQTLKVGEPLWGLFIKNKKLQTFPCPICKIETFEDEGAFNIETDTKYHFGHFKLIYYIKW